MAFGDNGIEENFFTPCWRTSLQFSILSRIAHPRLYKAILSVLRRIFSPPPLADDFAAASGIEHNQFRIGGLLPAVRGNAGLQSRRFIGNVC